MRHQYDAGGFLMIRLVALGVGLGLAASPALAEDEVPGISTTGGGISPEGTLAPVSIVEGPGWKVGEGTVLHPIVGIETGFVSNVFYDTADEDPKGAGIIRLIAQLSTASLSPQRLAPAGDGDAMLEGQENIGALQYRADLRLSYDFYLSGNDAVADQNGLGINGTFRGTVFPRRTWSFLYLENFQRLIRSTNFESSEQTNRDINRLQLGLQFAPVGRTIFGLLHFQNTIDVFEDDDQQFANRIQSSIGLSVNWRFRPVTVFFGDVTMGYFTGLGSESTKVDSYPLTITTGVQTLLTLNTSLVGRVGYTNGFYASGPSFSTVVGGVELGYRYSPTGRVTALYDYTHQDSINANFFRDHRFGLTIEQQVVPILVHLRPELRLRQYRGVMAFVPSGPDTRDDVIFSVAAGARYNFRDWFAGVVEYRLSSVQTDYTYMIGTSIDDPSYARHELVAGVRAAL